MSKHIARRGFLGLTTAAGMTAASAGAAAAQTISQGSIDGRPIRLGFVGVGDRGSHHLDAALGIDGVEVPAICDINPAVLHRAKGWIEETGKPTPRLYGKGRTDFERLCAEEELGFLRAMDDYLKLTNEGVLHDGGTTPTIVDNDAGIRGNARPQGDD